MHNNHPEIIGWSNKSADILSSKQHHKSCIEQESQRSQWASGQDFIIIGQSEKLKRICSWNDEDNLGQFQVTKTSESWAKLGS